MKDRIAQYVSEAFEGAPNTRSVQELRDEMISNLYDKYDDLVAKGTAEEDAYETVVSGIGDVSELVRSLSRDDVFDPAAQQEARKKTALVVSVCVGLYIAALIAAVIFGSLLPELPNLSGLTFLTIVGVSTCILIYHFMSRPKYKKADESMVEEFKEWKSGKGKQNKLKGSVLSIFWTLTVAVYFIVSFQFGNWAYSWIIFLIAAAVSEIIRTVFTFKE